MRLTTLQAMAIFLPLGVLLMIIAAQFFHFFSIPGLLSVAVIYFGLRYIIRHHVVITDRHK